MSIALNRNTNYTLTIIIPSGRVEIQIDDIDYKKNLYFILYKYLGFNTDADIFITSGNKLLTRYVNVKYLLDNGIKTLEIHPRIKGGGLVDMFMGIIKIGEFFMIIPQIILWLLKTIAWSIQFIGWFFSTFLNPVTLASDFANALIAIIVAILSVPIDLFFAFVEFGANTVGTMMSSIWGWDQSNNTAEDRNSNYFKDSKICRDKKCYLTKSNTVPFSVLLGTIICPPLGVFMEYGFTGWINILICLGLTLLFYFPGLLYALLIIYN